MAKLDVKALLRELEEARARLREVECPFRILETGVISFTGHGGRPVWLSPGTWEAIRKAIEDGWLSDEMLCRASDIYKPRRKAAKP